MKLPKDLHRLDVFNLTAEHGSFTKAAQALDISASMVSQHISKLETQLETKLFNRSTRVVRLTESGRLLYTASQDVFRRLEAALSNIDEVKQVPRGNIRINTQSNFAEIYLIPLLKQFSQNFPEVGFELIISDDVKDLRQESIDISFTVGQIENSDYYATRLNEFGLTICASPKYLEGKKHPKVLADLKDHDCILLSVLKDKNSWSFYNAKDELETIYLSTKAFTNSGIALKSMVESGLGIARIPDFIVRKSIDEGSLVELLPDYYSHRLSIYAVYHQQLHDSSFTIRSFVKFVKERLVLNKG